MRCAYRNEEARGPVGTIKGPRKQLQPGVIPIHNQLPRALGLHLRQPRVLRRQTGALVPFVEVEYDIEKGGDRAGCYRLESRHRDGRGGGMGREREGGAIANESGPVSLRGPRWGEGQGLRLREFEAAIFRIDKVTIATSQLISLCASTRAAR